MTSAVDTNVLARFLLQDDPEQSPLAEDAMRNGVFVSLTVLMETAWLLGSRYGQPRTAVAAVLRTIIAMPSVVAEAMPLLPWAIDRFEAGANLADVIHLIAARDQPGFVTFDKDLGARAGDRSPVGIQTLSV